MPKINKNNIEFVQLLNYLEPGMFGDHIDYNCFEVVMKTFNIAKLEWPLMLEKTLTCLRIYHKMKSRDRKDKEASNKNKRRR